MSCNGEIDCRGEEVRYQGTLVKGIREAGNKIRVLWLTSSKPGRDIGETVMDMRTSLMTVSRFWDLRGVVRGLDREEMMWARTSWLERVAD